MKNILIYSHDTYGLGNIRRSIAIANHLTDSDPLKNVLILSGSPMIHSFRLSARIDYIKLPCLSRTERNRYSSKFLNIHTDQLLETRTSLIKATIYGFKPDLIMIDKNPCGVSNELTEIVKHLNTLPERPKLVLLLRDILDECNAIKKLWKKEKYDDIVCACYDQVLVVGEKRIFDLAQLYEFSNTLDSKIDYCGYINRKVQCSLTGLDVPFDRRKILPRVLIMAGGGQDGYALLKNYLIAVQRHFNSHSHESLLFCGSELHTDYSVELETLGQLCSNTSVLTFTDCMEDYIASADVIVCMGGYNTICEAMSYNKKTIVVPRNKPVTEQIIRARKFEQLGLLRMIHPDELTPDAIANTLKEMLQEKTPAVPTKALNLAGLSNIQMHVDNLLKGTEITGCTSRKQFIPTDALAAELSG